MPPFRDLIKFFSETSKLSETLASSVKRGGKQYITAMRTIEIPTEHFLEGSYAGTSFSSVFSPLAGEIVDLQMERFTKAIGNDLFVTSSETKSLTTKPGDFILQTVSLSDPIVMDPKSFKKLYMPAKGMPGFALRKDSNPIYVDVSLIVRDWTPAPSRTIKTPPTYKKGDFVVSFYGGLLRKTIPQEDFLTFFRAKNLSPQAVRLLFRIVGPEKTLKLLGVPTGEPAFYIETPIYAEQTETGDWTVTFPNGEQNVFTNSLFSQTYVAAPELEKGYYQSTAQPQKFIQVNQSMVLETPLGEQNLRSGFYLNITDPQNVFGVEADQFVNRFQLSE